MIQQFMKMGGARTEEEFYAKYPTEQSFFEAFPQAQQYVRQYEAGGPKGQSAIIQVVKAVAAQIGMQPQQLMQALKQDPNVYKQLDTMAQQDPQQAATALMQMVQQAAQGQQGQQQQAQQSMPMDPNQAMQMAYGGESALSRFTNGGPYSAAAPMYDDNSYRTFPPNMPRLFGRGGMYQAPDDENSNEVDYGQMMQVPSYPGMTSYGRGIVTPTGVYVPSESKGPVNTTSIPMMDAPATQAAPGTTTTSSLKKNKIDPTGLTVSEIWQKVTGTPWSEAKKQGLTDGSYAKNVELRKMLLEGNVEKKKETKGSNKSKSLSSGSPSNTSSIGEKRKGRSEMVENINERYMQSPTGSNKPVATVNLPEVNITASRNPQPGLRPGTKDYYNNMTSQFGYTQPAAEDQLPDQINDYDSEGNAIYVDSSGKKYQYYGDTKVHPGTTLPYNQKLISGSNTPGAAPKKGMGDYYQEKKKAEKAKPKEKGMLEKAGDVFSEFYRNNPWMRREGGSHMRMYQPGGGVLDPDSIKTTVISMGPDAAAEYIGQMSTDQLGMLLQTDPTIFDNVNISALPPDHQTVLAGFAGETPEEESSIWPYAVAGAAVPPALLALGAGASNLASGYLYPVDPKSLARTRAELGPISSYAQRKDIPLWTAMDQYQSSLLPLPEGGGAKVGIDADAMKRMATKTSEYYKELEQNYMTKLRVSADDIPAEVKSNMRLTAGMRAAGELTATSGVGHESARNFFKVAKLKDFAGSSVDDIAKAWVNSETKISGLSKASKIIGKPSKAALIMTALSALTGFAGGLYGSYKKSKDKKQNALDRINLQNAGNNILMDSTANYVNQAATFAPGSEPPDTAQTQNMGQPRGYKINGVDYLLDNNTGFFMAPDSTALDPDFIPANAVPIQKYGGVNAQSPLGYGAYNVVFLDGGESASPGFYTPDNVIDEKKNALMDFVESQKQIYQMRYGGSNFSKKKKELTKHQVPPGQTGTVDLGYKGPYNTYGNEDLYPEVSSPGPYRGTPMRSGYFYDFGKSPSQTSAPSQDMMDPTTSFPDDGYSFGSMPGSFQSDKLSSDEARLEQSGQGYAPENTLVGAVNQDDQEAYISPEGRPDYFIRNQRPEGASMASDEQLKQFRKNARKEKRNNTKTGQFFKGIGDQWRSMTAEQKVNVGLAAGNWMLDQVEQRKEKKRMKQIDDIIQANRFTEAPTDRGMYMTNTAAPVPPTQQTPVQFSGYNPSAFAKYGKEKKNDYVYLTPEQIKRVIEMGGEVEFLD